ncbi:hypothetical protein [Pseudonocardia sp. T1-2H]
MKTRRFCSAETWEAAMRVAQSSGAPAPASNRMTRTRVFCSVMRSR